MSLLMTLQLALFSQNIKETVKAKAKEVADSAVKKIVDVSMTGVGNIVDHLTILLSNKINNGVEKVNAKIDGNTTSEKLQSVESNIVGTTPLIEDIDAYMGKNHPNFYNIILDIKNNDSLVKNIFLGYKNGVRKITRLSTVYGSTIFIEMTTLESMNDNSNYDNTWVYNSFLGAVSDIHMIHDYKAKGLTVSPINDRDEPVDQRIYRYDFILKKSMQIASIGFITPLKTTLQILENQGSSKQYESIKATQAYKDAMVMMGNITKTAKPE
jgi:hypothetical protein